MARGSAGRSGMLVVNPEKIAGVTAPRFWVRKTLSEKGQRGGEAIPKEALFHAALTGGASMRIDHRSASLKS